MDKYFPKKLREIYDSGGKGLLIKSPEQTLEDFKKQVRSLKALDYIEVIDKTIGGVVIKLTPNGIKFCENIDNTIS